MNMTSWVIMSILYILMALIVNVFIRTSNIELSWIENLWLTAVLAAIAYIVMWQARRKPK